MKRNLPMLFNTFYKYRPFVERKIIESGVTRTTYKSTSDLSQEVFCQLWKCIDTYDPHRSDPLTFLRQITQSVIGCNFRKSKAACRDHTKTVSMECAVVAKKVGEESLHISETIESEYISDQVESELYRVFMHDYIIKRLQHQERYIVTARFTDDRSWDEIGSEVGMSKQTAFSNWNRIIRNKVLCCL